MNDVVITYLCDRKACTHCTAPECMHTVDIRHAVNFESHISGTRTYFCEKDPEDGQMSRFLTPEAMDFINSYPMFVNDIVARIIESEETAIKYFNDAKGILS